MQGKQASATSDIFDRKKSAFVYHDENS